MNDELDSKIKKLQEKVNHIREKTLTLQQITKENLQKTSDNMRNIIQLTESVDSIMGDPNVTEIITENIKNINPKQYLNFVETNNFSKQLPIKEDTQKNIIYRS